MNITSARFNDPARIGHYATFPYLLIQADQWPSSNNDEQIDEWMVRYHGPFIEVEDTNKPGPISLGEFNTTRAMREPLVSVRVVADFVGIKSTFMFLTRARQLIKKLELGTEFTFVLSEPHAKRGDILWVLEYQGTECVACKQHEGVTNTANTEKFYPSLGRAIVACPLHKHVIQASALADRNKSAGASRD